ncbi:MAG: DUF456 domain-containing protein [Akkermansiaceae bacterium]|jgi:uncharacterized protein|nr:DUF456 domain-containing protein [Akkermansiaceae bacterium]MDP4647103.1 DUF456 domain-containing protein [Akkermansiaceae bacterium]MDP4722445.1 DUF456 domain-containing protein [Akkermansiaceae bacterium]MDP4780151.1 DUF456 domain-containing protein [Akkermansiaceae bacterium]MDP4897846.1 DUF456 domain-containing protein [Akkermansiaceae bacterium]
MTEFLENGGVWIVTGGLLAGGLAGCIVPVIPGHLLILVGAVVFRILKGAEAGIAWWGFAILVAIMAISQAVEFFSSSLGSKWFGGSRAGGVGAIIGSIVGLFFFPFGLLIGPLVGAFVFEMIFAKKKTRESVVSGVGSVVGTVAGMGFKIAAGVLMIAWFFADVFFLKS